jgi:hypothetical protein
MTETSFNEQKNLSTNKLDLNLRKKPVKCCTWSIALYGVVSGHFGKNQKYLESFETWCWRRMEKFIWTDRMSHEVLRRVEEEGNVPHTIKRRKANWIVHTLRRNFLLKKNTLLKEKIGGNDKGDGKTRKMT